MREARTKVNLGDLGITGVRFRRAITGALIIEVPSKQSGALADKLAVNLKRAFAAKRDVKVDRPTKMAELRLKGMDESVTPLEIAAAVAKIGGCEIEEVRVGDK